MRFPRCLPLLVAVLAGWSAAAPAAELTPRTAEEVRARQIVGSAAFGAAVAAFERDFDRFVRELILLTEIPAPPFKEQLRAEAYAKLFRELGLAGVEIDPEGNVLGLWRGRPGGSAPLLAVAAHLDTVFPEGTNVKVKRDGTRLMAPGIGDDTRGLAFLLAAIRALQAAKIETPGDILFVGNVGEEGPGDLRGMRYLFGKSPWRDKIKRFIAIDGGNNDLITNGGLGSKRYRVTFKGPGGHSWGAFGQVSPAFAMGNAIASLSKVVAPRQPKVSYNVGIVSGGTSVNSIPFEVAMEIDLRSVSADELRKLDAQFLKIVADAVDEENATRATTFGRISADIKLMGERPSGVTSPESAALRQVMATMQAFDKVPVWNTGSTDANIPISLGIPAFAMATQSAQRGGRAHSLDEWTDVEKGTAVKDFSLALALILSVAEMP